MGNGAGVSAYQRLRQKQVLCEAEGYLDLITALAEQWPLRADVRDRVAERALSALERLDSTRGCEALMNYLRGQAFRIMERYQDAIPSLVRSAEIDPENIRVWLALGWCYKRTGRLDLAIQSLEEALAVDKGQAIIHYNLACYWGLANNPKLAVSYLTQAFHLDVSFRELVPSESDFDLIREHPSFQELTRAVA